MIVSSFGQAYATFPTPNSVPKSVRFFHIVMLSRFGLSCKAPSPIFFNDSGSTIDEILLYASALTLSSSTYEYGENLIA